MRSAFPGARYHVTVRGNERKALVRDDQDRQRFLNALRRSVSDYGVLLHVFGLMEKHYC
jgi:putative transposase